MPTPSDRDRRNRRTARSHRSRTPQHPDLIRMGQHARGFFGSAALGLARHIIGPSQIQIKTSDRPIPTNRSFQGNRHEHGGHPRHQARTQHRQRSWTIAPNRRSQLVFGQGDLSQVFSCLTQLWQDSPGAGIAVCRFITMHQRPTDPQSDYAMDRARNTLTRMLRKATPNAASLASARDGIDEARNSHDPKGFLTAQTTYLEEQYLCFVHGRGAEISLRELAKQLVANAEALEAAGSEGRQAYPRIMAADVLLQLGDITSANEQIAQGFSLIGKAYPNPEMVKLGKVHA